jgi:hypothetical protein
MMKIVKIDTLAILFATFTVLTACKDKSDDEGSPYVGNYTISSAKIAEAINLEINGPAETVVPITIPVGQDITVQIQQSLLSAVDCQSAGNAYVELRKDYSIFMSCAGENEFNAGTWEEVNDSTLILNMNQTAIPSSPSGFALTVEGIDKSSAGMSGTTSVPLPKEMIEAMLQGATLVSTTPAVIPVVFTIDFDKK